MYPNFHHFLLENSNLSSLSSETWMDQFKSKTVAKGEFLLKAGGICQHSFFVESGLLRMYAIDEEGKEHIVQFASENWILSDRSSVFFEEPSEYYIDAIEDTEVVLLESNFVSEVLVENDGFQEFNERLLHNHIRHLQRRIHRLLAASAEERYLSFVAQYPDLLLRVPQWMIASYLGMTPESLSRVRRDLAKKNFKPLK